MFNNKKNQQLFLLKVNNAIIKILFLAFCIVIG